jgi:hypothetical protein
MQERQALTDTSDRPLEDKAKTGFFLNLLISLLLSLIVISYFLIAFENCRHWFIIPALSVGVLVGADAVGWLRGRLDVFDPAGIIGLMLFLRDFVGGLLTMTLGGPNLPSWMPPGPADWRPWVGWMTALNVGGIIVYLFTRFLFGPRRGSVRERTRLIKPESFPLLAGVLLTLTGLLQVGSFAMFGGLSGFISAYETRAEGFGGMGILFMISESFPVIAMMGYAAHLKRKNATPSWFTIVIVLLIFFALRLVFFGGLRGSRSNTIWGVFWAAGIVHFWVRRIPKKLIIFGLAGLMVFVYVWGFYKAAGLEGLKGAVIEGRANELEEETGRTESAAWLSGGVQPYTLYRICKENSDYEYAWGRTYLGAIAKLIPRFIWRDRPPGKVREGTDALYGKGSYPNVVTSKVFGLAGEAMLNFGPFAVPFAFVFLGFAVGRVRRWIAGLTSNDTRWLLVPFLVNLCVVIHGGDSDNLIFFFFKNGALPLLLVYLGSKRLNEFSRKSSWQPAAHVLPNR